MASARLVGALRSFNVGGWSSFYWFGISDRLLQFLHDQEVIDFDAIPLEPTPVNPSKP